MPFLAKRKRRPWNRCLKFGKNGTKLSFPLVPNINWVGKNKHSNPSALLRTKIVLDLGNH